MENNIYEDELDLKDLMFWILKKWRLIMLIAILFVVLLGGYIFVKELRSQGNEKYITELKEQYQAEEAKYEQSKKGYERDIENFNINIAYQEKYKEDSILLKVDPYNKGVASADIFVKMVEVPYIDGITITSVDPADSVVKAYASAIQQGGFSEEISSKIGIDLIYLKELINVTMDYDSNMLNVSIAYKNKEGAGEILDLVLENLKTMYPDIQEHLGKHRLAVMNQSSGVISDQTLADYQNQKIADLAATNKNLEETEKALNALEQPLKPVALSRLSIVKSGVKYGALGGVAGTFLVVFGLCVVYIMNGRLNTNDVLKKRFGLKHLGSFSEQRENSFVIDMWLDKLEGKDTVSDDSVYDIITANILGMLNMGESVYLTGLIKETHLCELVEKIGGKLSELKLGFGTDLIHNALTIQKLQEYDKVILVEVRGLSKIRDIEKEIEIVQNMKRQVLGYIVINSCIHDIDN